MKFIRSTKSPLLFIAIVACAALIGAGCGDSNESEPSTSDKAETSESAAEEKLVDAMKEQPKVNSSPKPAAQPATAPDSLTSVRENLTIKASDSDFGSIIYDQFDQVFYLFEADEGSTSTCYGSCAEAWPPVLVSGTTQAGKGAQGKLIGTTKRKDGATQLTYGGKPMYYYAHEAPGEVKCHNVFLDGGLWLVIQPNGSAAPA